jgi:peptidoglycan/LPS O-acetylase OafA/YrhL
MTVSTTANARPKAKQGAGAYRIPAFDFTKGTLVLFMVVWHWLNYFYGTQGNIYKYLRFLTPSFIFITGFLISYVHFSKYGVGSSTLSKRLFLRGVKLLGVFVALNLLVSFLVPESFLKDLVSGRSIGADLDAIFFTARLSGDGMGKVAAFGILVPISYVLMLAALLSLACRFFKYTFQVVCAALIFGMAVAGLKGIQSANLELVTVGLLGIVFGYVREDQLQKLVSRPWAILTIYLFYLVAITIWEVSIYVQMVGAVLTTALIYLVGVQTERPSRLRDQILLLGRYSLFGYISQIAILQLLHTSLRHFDSSYAILGASFVAAVALTMLSVVIVDRWRAKSKAIDGIYRAVFA